MSAGGEVLGLTQTVHRELPFSEATRAWFGRAFGEPTPVQALGWAAIAKGEDALLIAPTGSGKTLAAFLVALDRIGSRPREEGERGWRAIYISPLKALVYDVERNLGTPLVGIEVVAKRLGLPFSALTVDVRTGDTTSQERRRQVDKPGDILVTTPESLYLLLTSEARKNLLTVETLIIDEIHALAPTKRGAHLMLSVERLEAVAKTRPQRIGLSATVRPAEDVAKFLSGSRPVAIVDTAAPPRLDLEVIVPVDDMTRPHLELALSPGWDDPSKRSGPLLVAAAEKGGLGAVGAVVGGSPRERMGLWPAIEPKILELVLAHRSTIVFVNSRGLAERLAQRLNELHEEWRAAIGEGGDGDGGAKESGSHAPLARAHHGSVAHSQRREIEELLKGGELRAIVATSSLELGIDMGAVDLVIQVESPDSSARGLQRVGRAGHHVGGVSRGKIFPKHRGDLLEAAVVSRMMLEGKIEALTIPRNPLDVLAQQIVAMVAVEPWSVEGAKNLVRRAYPFAELTDDVWLATLDMLAGRFPSTDLADLRPRITWNRTTDMLESRKGTRLIATVNGGTIPDRGLYAVFLATGETEGSGKPVRVGELDEEMVHEARVGETFLLGASTWRIAEITRDRVMVTPAPGEAGKMPFWKGDGPGRPIETGRVLGAFTRQLAELVEDEDEADRFLAVQVPLDAKARKNLIAHVRDQRAATGLVPSDRTIVIERFKDELGDVRICILTPFGARVHAPWALALEETIGQKTGQEVQAIYTDDGIALRFADGDKAPGWDELWIEPAEIEDRLIERLGTSAMFSGVFRENAARALLLPRRSPQGRAPLWQQRLRSQALLAAVRQHPGFPIILETYRTCLKDVFDLPALVGLLAAIERREVRVHEVDTVAASPFSRGLAFAYVAQYMYEVDNPVAERRAQALTLDRNLLRELLGQDEMRSLFSVEVIAELEDELQLLVDPYRVTDADRVQDALRRLGALETAELVRRAEPGLDVAGLVRKLAGERRIVSMRLAGREQWVAVEDCAMYRDGVGALPPNGLPAALLAPVDEALAMLVLRFARTHGPFAAERVATWLALPVVAVLPTLGVLARQGRLAEGAFLPGGSGHEYCEVEVLRRLRRRMLAVLRNEVAPVDGKALCRFLIGWQGVGGRSREKRLVEVVAQLEGLALPFSELEGVVLPARLPGFSPRMLDEACALGEIVWVGRGALGAKDGRVALYRRETVGQLFEWPEVDAQDELSLLHRSIFEILAERGAAFYSELVMRVGQRLGATTAELTQALWDLVWSGRVTNDTFAPLRAYAAGGASPPPDRRGANRSTLGLGGRWSLTRELAGEANPTERALSRVHGLLERWGLVFREVAELEGVVGGFSALTPALRMMEDLGKVRRGHFVEGLGSAQFALPGVVDRLRTVASQTVEADGRMVVMATTDPANPWGAFLPWPAVGDGVPGKAARAPKRAANTMVVVHDGEPMLWVGNKLNKVVTFRSCREDERLAVAAFVALAGHVRRRRGDGAIHEVDGVAVRGSRWEALLREAGFAADYRGMVLGAAPTTPRARQAGYAPPTFATGFAPPTVLGRGVKGEPRVALAQGPFGGEVGDAVGSDDGGGFVPPTSFGASDAAGSGGFVPPTFGGLSEAAGVERESEVDRGPVPSDPHARRFFFRRNRR